MMFKHLYDNTKTLFGAFQFHYDHIATLYHTPIWFSAADAACRVALWGYS